MPVCYLCQDVTKRDLEPCPNNPPCKPVDICGYPVVRCQHKEAARAVDVSEEDDV